MDLHLMLPLEIGNLCQMSLRSLHAAVQYLNEIHLLLSAAAQTFCIHARALLPAHGHVNGKLVQELTVWGFLFLCSRLWCPIMWTLQGLFRSSALSSCHVFDIWQPFLIHLNVFMCEGIRMIECIFPVHNQSHLSRGF